MLTEGDNESRLNVYNNGCARERFFNHPFHHPPSQRGGWAGGKQSVKRN